MTLSNGFDSSACYRLGRNVWCKVNQTKVLVATIYENGEWFLFAAQRPCSASSEDCNLLNSIPYITAHFESEAQDCVGNLIGLKKESSMDPNECLRRWRDAFAAGNQDVEAREAQQDLTDWLNNGGFWPSRMHEEEIKILRTYMKLKVKTPSDYIYG